MSDGSSIPPPGGGGGNGVSGRYGVAPLSLKTKPSYIMPEKKMRSVWEDFYMYLRQAAAAPHAVNERPGKHNNKQSDSSLFTLPGLNFGNIDSLPILRIPDTLVMRFGKPLFWYFTDKSGKLRRKHQKNMQIDKIIKKFGSTTGFQTEWQSERACDIVAFFIPKDERLTATFLDKDGLVKFFSDERREMRDTGILQKFVAPRSIQNEVLRMEWTPNVCVLERRLNENRLDAPRIGIYDRAVTYEGDQNVCAETLLDHDGMLARNLARACRAMGIHMAKAMGQTRVAMPSKMVCYFKWGAGNQFWFMFCDHIAWDSVIALPTSSMKSSSERGMNDSSSSYDDGNTTPVRTPLLPSALGGGREHSSHGHHHHHHGGHHGQDIGTRGLTNNRGGNYDLESEGGGVVPYGSVPSLGGHFHKGSSDGAEHVTPTHFHFMLTQPGAFRQMFLEPKKKKKQPSSHIVNTLDISGDNPPPSGLASRGIDDSLSISVSSSDANESKRSKTAGPTNSKGASSSSSSSSSSMSCQNCGSIMKSSREKTVVQLTSLIALRHSTQRTSNESSSNKESSSSTSTDNPSTSTSSTNNPSDGPRSRASSALGSRHPPSIHEEDASQGTLPMLTGDRLIGLLDGVWPACGPRQIKEKIRDSGFLTTPTRMCNRCFQAMLNVDMNEWQSSIAAAVAEVSGRPLSPPRDVNRQSLSADAKVYHYPRGSAPHSSYGFGYGARIGSPSHASQVQSMHAIRPHLNDAFVVDQAQFSVLEHTRDSAPPLPVRINEVEHTAAIYGIPAKPKPRVMQRSEVDGHYYSGDDDESSVASGPPTMGLNNTIGSGGRFPPLSPGGTRTGLSSSASAPMLINPKFPSPSPHTRRSQPMQIPEDMLEEPQVIMPPSSGTGTTAYRTARAHARAILRAHRSVHEERSRLEQDDALAARDRAYGATFSWRSRMRATADPLTKEGGAISNEYGTSLHDDVEAKIMLVGLVDGDEKHAQSIYSRSLGPSALGKGAKRRGLTGTGTGMNSSKSTSRTGARRDASPSTRPLWTGAPGPYVGHHVHGKPPPRRAGSSGPLPPKKDKSLPSNPNELIYDDNAFLSDDELQNVHSSQSTPTLNNPPPVPPGRVPLAVTEEETDDS